MTSQGTEVNSTVKAAMRVIIAQDRVQWMFVLVWILLLATSPTCYVRAYAVNGRPSMALAMSHPSTSSLASKVIYQSPPIENLYKDFVISSKPLNLKKYSNNMKVKKTKKDSKIYYIPMPPLPYRYIPGVGYDYQPMKINPIIRDSVPAMSSSSISNKPMNSYASHQLSLQPNRPNPQHPYQKLPFTNPIRNGIKKKEHHHSVDPSFSNKKKVNSTGFDESKMHRLHRNDYFFNGKPFKLKVASARSKHNLSPHNLESKFYFNKNIIY